MAARRRAGEGAVVLCAVLLQLGGPTTGPPLPDPPVAVQTLGTALALGQGLALVPRRSRPGLAGVLVLTGLLAQVLLVRPAPPYAAQVAIWSAVRHGRATPVRVAVPLGVAGVLGVSAIRWPEASGWVPFALMVTTVVALTAALAEARVARAAAVEREKDAAAARAAAEERLRIARDLHDLLGHGLTGIAVQSSTARLALEDGDAERATTALRAVEASARDALDEVRQVVGVLRSGPETTPARRLSDLPDLVAGVRDTGVDVELDLRAAAVPPALGLTAYRVVQEALTNAVRHAPGAGVRVVVDDEPGALRVIVDDDGAASPVRPGSGHGLAGMRERVVAAGGRVQAGPRSGGGWRVDVRLPRRQDT